jgi:hypothetical protein
MSEGVEVFRRDGKMSALSNVPGVSQLKDWFGYIPNFHDAEVVGLDLRRGADPSTLHVHTWRTSSEVDQNGNFRRDRHATVSFVFSNIVELEVRDWNYQNVLARMDITKNDEGHTIILTGSFGVDGRIVANLIGIGVEPRVVDLSRGLDEQQGEGK